MPIKILNSVSIRKVATRGGRQINVKFANETDAWRRTYLSQEIRDHFIKAMEKADVPPAATTAIMAETQHPSQKDSYPHYTVVYQDDQGNHVTTKHVYP